MITVLWSMITAVIIIQEIAVTIQEVLTVIWIPCLFYVTWVVYISLITTIVMIPIIVPSIATLANLVNTIM